MPLHIVTLSHLAWERQLFQRPQQLMTRFAAMDDPVHYFALIGLRRYIEMNTFDRLGEAAPNLQFQNIPFLPFSKRIKPMRRLTMKLLSAKAKAPLKSAPEGSRILWIQNPAYVDAIDDFPRDLTIYDKMDPFHAFKASDRDIGEREDRLLGKADLVFTGGRSLHRLIEGKHDRVFCYPSGIDFDHFARAAEDGTVPDEIAKIKRPILGYFGAVDERIDWGLIDYLCRERAHWQIVFLGPKVLIDEIPVKARNFHWLGPKKYEFLPDYLRAFDACLIPWLVNDLTSYMSPTKTPEYLAAGRPVVSTPIPDVMADFPEEALIGGTPEAFLSKCTDALMQGKGPARKPPQSRTWEEIASQMRTNIMEALPGSED